MYVPALCAKDQAIEPIDTYRHHFSVEFVAALKVTFMSVLSVDIPCSSPGRYNCASRTQ
jgi:hypothetical protein